MEFYRRARGNPAVLGILPGAFNPPTVAHVALARAALARVDEVLWVLPRAFPHKVWDGAPFEARVRMLRAALCGEPRFSIGASERGLFVEIARECREAYGERTALLVLCGRDAAERIVGWDYGTPGAIDAMLEEFGLLVASRGGRYDPPARLRRHIEHVELEMPCDGISATEVRRRIAAKEPWEHLVPPEVVPLAREIYRP